jgi:hypothetical protein
VGLAIPKTEYGKVGKSIMEKEEKTKPGAGNFPKVPRARTANSTSAPTNLEIERGVLHIYLQLPGPGNNVQIA